MYESIKNLYKEHFNIDGDLVDLLADYEIMYYCVTGLSNKDISEILDIEEKAIKDVLINRFNFYGWRTNLDYNPIFIYNKVNGNKVLFYTAIKAIFPEIPKFIINKSFAISKKFTKYEYSIDRKFN